MRTLTTWFYLSVIALACLLSDRALGFRAAVAGAWVTACILAITCAVKRCVRTRRTRRGWIWLENGLCSRCAYPINRAFLRCPECGGKVGAPPDAPATTRIMPGERPGQPGISFGSFNIS